MQNSKNQNSSKETATNVNPNTGTPVSTVTTDTKTKDQKPVAETNEQLSIDVMKPKAKTLYEKFENAKVFNAKKAFYDDFKERLDSVKQFRQNHDGSGLNLTIKNQTSLKTVEFQNQSLILSFLDEAIKQGDLFLEGCEIEMLNLEI